MDKIEMNCIWVILKKVSPMFFKFMANRLDKHPKITWPSPFNRTLCVGYKNWLCGCVVHKRTCDHKLLLIRVVIVIAIHTVDLYH